MSWWRRGNGGGCAVNAMPFTTMPGCSRRASRSTRYICAQMWRGESVAGVNAADLEVGAFVHRGTVARWYLDDAEVFEAVATPPQDAISKPQIGVYTRYRELETLAFSLSAPHSATLYNKPREIRTKSP